jgi:hypothetical protein
VGQLILIRHKHCIGGRGKYISYSNSYPPAILEMHASSPFLKLMAIKRSIYVVVFYQQELENLLFISLAEPGFYLKQDWQGKHLKIQN